jgi:hypothetical protein
MNILTTLRACGRDSRTVHALADFARRISGSVEVVSVFFVRVEVIVAAVVVLVAE